MKLYHSPTSPYVRKIHVMLQETGQLGDVELVPAGGTPVDSGTIPTNLNPLRKIPVLELDNGDAIYDSRVICRFFDDRAKAGLYGDDPWQILTLEATADGILDAAILMVYEARVRPEDKQWDGWKDAQWKKIQGALDMIEDRWIDILPWDFKNAAQIAVGCALGYLDLRHPDRNWRDGHPKLAAWEAEFAKRPSMASTVPPAG